MNNRTRRRVSGFALVLVLALLSIAVLIAVALSALTNVSSDTARNALYQVQAKQNALVGLGVALRELQSAAGGDVVTASASIRGLSVKFPSLLGIWPIGNTNALPPNWMVSGNLESEGANQITYAKIPSDSLAITLVGKGTTVSSTADTVKVTRVEATDSGDGYAFWIGDEGNKPSLGFGATDVPLAPSGAPLLPDPRGEIPAFEFSNTNRSRVLVWHQIREIAPGASLQSRFHSYTAQNFWVTGSSALQGGLFNVNTTALDAWAAVLRSYESAKSASQPAFESGEDVGVLAAKLVGNFSGKSSSAKVRYGPFRTVAGFWDSGIIQDSLDEADITTITQDDLRVVLYPLLAVRSDTFRIRA